MTAPFTRAGFPESQEYVSGDPTGDSGALKPETAGQEKAPSIKTVGKGFWLTAAPEKVAKDLDQRWNAQNKAQKTGIARGELNERRRAGDPYSKLVKDTDQDTFRVYTPKGIEQAPPSLNKSDDLSVKVVANIYADPPKPECEPASDSDEDRSAAEFSTRVLMNESTESGMNIPDLIWDAEDVACSWGSGYVYAYIDQQGGGHRPKEVMAPAEAVQIGPDGQPVVDDTMSEPVLRYVAADGVSITDVPDEAMLEWMPRVCGEVLTRKSLRFLPETCSGIRDAEGVLIAAFDQLGELKAKFPEVVGKMSAEDLTKLVNYRPEIAKLLLPKHAGSGEGTKSPDHDSSKGPPDDALCLTITGYRRGSAQYPLGAYVVMGGEKFLLHRQTWHEEIPGKAKGQTIKRAMDVPVAQFRQFKDSKGNDPHGKGLVDRIGDGDPLTSFAIGAVIEYLHRVNNPHLFVPIGSGIQAKSLQLPRGVPIPFNPSGGGVPKQEEIAPLPPAFMEFVEFIRADQDSVAGLQQAAQGVASASVQSGKHAQQIIEQALVALGGVKQGSDSGYMRLCRIVLQLIRKYYTTPMRIKIVGEDGAFKEKEWLGADLGTTTDVKIMAGTSTMLTQSAKSQIALEKFQLGAISLEDFQRAETGNVRALIGAQDNPHKVRIAGQISAWNDGPPEGWAPPQQTPGVDPMTGQPLPPPVDPANPFSDVRAVDSEQPVAMVRHQALNRAMAGHRIAKYRTEAPVWAGYLEAEYAKAAQEAGVQTLAQQAEAMQQQAMQQQQAVTDQQAQADQQKVAQQQEGEAVKAQEKQMADEQARVAKEQERAASLEAEERAAQRQMEMEERKHQMALEMEQAKAQIAATMPQAQPAAESTSPRTMGSVNIAPPDLTPIVELVATVKESIDALANREQPAPVVNVQPPEVVVNVPAPVVNIEAPPAPVVNVPRQPRPEVKVEVPKKRKGTITGPDGETYTVESEVVD